MTMNHIVSLAAIVSDASALCKHTNRAYENMASTSIFPAIALQHYCIVRDAVESIGDGDQRTAACQLRLAAAYANRMLHAEGLGEVLFCEWVAARDAATALASKLQTAASAAAHNEEARRMERAAR